MRCKVMDVGEILLTPSDIALTFLGGNVIKRPAAASTAAARPTIDPLHPIGGKPENISKQQNSENVRHLIEDLAGTNREVSIAVDQETRQIVVKVLNSETQEVIRQIPPEEALRLARALKELSGTLVDEVA
jgi:uncharacterized FlaG/YvyC family protein